MSSGSYFLKGALLCFLAVGNFAFASGKQAPPPFVVNGSPEKAVFLDFKTATYDIVYDVPAKKARVHSIIRFEMANAGFPTIDMADVPETVKLDGNVVNSQSILPPDGDFPVRVMMQKAGVGEHTLEITNWMEGKFVSPVYSETGVASGFFMNDLQGAYLQNYLPSNFEFSQFAITFNVSIVGAKDKHIVFANGVVRQTSENSWTVVYPTYFNASAVFFHLTPVKDIDMKTFEVTSGGGETIKAVVYSKGPNANLDSFVNSAMRTMKDLTERFGKFPHPSLIIYGATPGGGAAGMEYAGACVTEAWALPHELAHSYFGRGILPANGNAGWIDEALATYATLLPHHPSANGATPMNMGSHSPYYTKNDSNGYVAGSDLFAFFGEMFTKISDKLTLDGFLKQWVAHRQYETMDNETLQKDLESYGGTSLTKEFAKYVYGKDLAQLELSALVTSDYEVKMSREQLQNLQ